MFFENFADLRNEPSVVPIYRRIADILRGRIIDGSLKPGDKLPSEAELSARLLINNRTLRKSLQILSDQGLITQCQGRGTFVAWKKPASLRFGVVLGGDDFKDNFYLLRLIAALDAARTPELDCDQTLLRPVDSTTPEALMDLVNARQCNGLISIGTNAVKALRSAAFDHLPLVFVNTELDEALPENRYHVRLGGGAIKAAVEYLVARGHRRIAYCGLPSSNLLRRNREFREAAEKYALTVPPPPAAGVDGDDPYRSARRYAAALGGLSAADRPTALVCPGLSFAQGAWQGVMDAGKKIPEDISLIGFDVSALVNPGMTTLVQPLEEMASKAVSLLFAQRDAVGKALKKHLYEYPAAIAERGSVRSIKPPKNQEDFK